MKLNKKQLLLLSEGADAAAIAAAASASDEDLTLTPEQIAAAAATAAFNATNAGKTPEQLAAAAAEAATQAAADAAAQAALAAASTPNAVVAHLTTQLTEANTQLVTAKVEAAGFKAAAEANAGLLSVVRQVLGDRLVALGGTAATAETFSAGNIAAEFGRIDAVYKAQFKIGGVAVQPGAKPVKAEIDPALADAMKFSLIQ